MSKQTKSEKIFESVCLENNISFSRIEEASHPTPDYDIAINGQTWSVELKQLERDANFQGVNGGSIRTVGDHVRKAIEVSRRQVQSGSNRGLPSLLVIYNALDTTWHMFGTEPHDFAAAMHGAFTIVTDGNSIFDKFQGKESKLRENFNSSFSAIGHLRPNPTTGHGQVVLYLNRFAKLPLNVKAIPNCFVLGELPTIDAIVG